MSFMLEKVVGDDDRFRVTVLKLAKQGKAITWPSRVLT